MADDARDHPAQAAGEVRASAVDDGEVDPAKPIPQGHGGTVAGEKRRHLGALPGEKLVRLRLPRSHEGGAGRFGSYQDDAAVSATQGGHGPAQQQDVAEGPGPDDERCQGTSMRAVEALPSRSVPRTTRTWGPGEPRFPTGMS